MKIGVGITTKNRNEVFRKTLSEIAVHTHNDFCFAVVDDGSDIPLNLDYLSHMSVCPKRWYRQHRFETSVGIAAAKNKCFEMLEECDHIFLFDDDTYPTSPDWWKPYVESPEPHLMYIFQDFPKGPKVHDTIKLYHDDNIVAFSHPRGCMLYYDRKCLELVGGMDTVYGKWGYEHGNLSDRIYNNGLTRFRYMDVPDSGKLFYSGDEHRTVKSTVWGRERDIQIQRNKRIYEANVNSTEFFPYKEEQKPTATLQLPYKEKRNEVLTCYFTGVPDPQGVKREANPREIDKLLCSLDNKEIESYGGMRCFHDCFVDITLTDLLDNPYWIATKAMINPYWQRWVTYREYLIKNRDHLGFVWCVDATDVEMLRDPFPHMDYGKLYVGDELGNIGGNVWLARHHKHPQLQYFFRNNRNPILNAGLVGGDVETMIEFTGHMIDVYQRCEHDAQIKGWPNSGMTDMGALNYVVYTHFWGRFSHGKHVNTQFKGYEADNVLSWYRHK